MLVKAEMLYAGQGMQSGRRRLYLYRVLMQKAGWLYSYAKTWEQEHIRQETEVKWTVFITLYTRTGEKLLVVEKQMFKNL